MQRDAGARPGISAETCNFTLLPTTRIMTSPSEEPKATPSSQQVDRYLIADPLNNLNEILEMFRSITGREPTPEEVEQARKDLEEARRILTGGGNAANEDPRACG
jgi:hypothetical protein